MFQGFSRTAHQKYFTVDAAFPCFLSNTLAKSEVNWMGSCRENRNTNRQRFLHSQLEATVSLFCGETEESSPVFPNPGELLPLHHWEYHHQLHLIVARQLFCLWLQGCPACNGKCPVHCHWGYLPSCGGQVASSRITLIPFADCFPSSPL